MSNQNHVEALRWCASALQGAVRAEYLAEDEQLSMEGCVKTVGQILDLADAALGAALAPVFKNSLTTHPQSPQAIREAESAAPGSAVEASEALPAHWLPIGLLGANATFQRAAREYAEEYARVAISVITPQPLHEAEASQTVGGEVSDEQIIAINAGERYFSESPTKYPEAGHGTQYHAGAPGVIGFARALLALAGGETKGVSELKCSTCGGRGWVMTGYAECAGADECPDCIGGSRE